ncbi:MAG: hypothetical protein DYG94_03310 [Leptolyngbya sp. PLA3]|nr:MAG: hypothetical protein EDM82_10990 [Cyanobacteria bacterium CYA]MCE7967759.1 hypothetical protein [Leptolyngbya sp. PL-A3]
MKKTLIVTGAAVLLGAGVARADFTITQSGAQAPTYATTLNFDEIGGPVGTIAPDSFAALGLSYLQSGEGTTVVGDNDAGAGWGLGQGNSFYGAWGVFMNFSADLTNFSAQVWDPSGPPTFTGGGLAVILFNDGVEVGSSWGHTPAWGGLGDTWFDIGTTNGDMFDEVRILGFGFFPTTVIDNLSWNMVPSPGTGGVAALGVMALRRRRR